MGIRSATQSAGSMREKVIFQRRVSMGQDDMGAVRGEWVNYATVSARITPINGVETVLQERLQPVLSYVITVRYSSVLASASSVDRLIDPRTGRIFNITWIDNLDERKRFLVMTCQIGTETG